MGLLRRSLIVPILFCVVGCNSSSADLDSAPALTATTAGASSSTQTAVDADQSTVAAEVEVEAEADGEGTEPGEVGDPAVVAAFAEAVNANVVLAALDAERALIWHRGDVVQLAIGGGGIWSDGDFVYRWSGADGVTSSSTAATLDGTVVCEADGPIHHATRRSDGTFVMAVELDAGLQDWDGRGSYGVPLDAVDCATGDRQPIEPVLVYGGEAEARFTERLAGRVFTGTSDAEGNAHIVNEQDVSINGDDYAGYHTFSGDGSLVIYGDMQSGAGPHLSTVVVGRDTTSGQKLWDRRFDLAFRSLWFIDQRAVISFIDDEAELFDFGNRIDRAVVLDGVTGTQLDEVSVGFDLLYLG